MNKPVTPPVSLPDLATFRQRVAAFLDGEMTEAIRSQQPMEQGLGPEGRAFARKLGATGWLGAGWPIEYGGSGGSIEYEIVLTQEFARRRACIPNVIARMMAGPVILARGSERLKREFLPRIARGEIEFSLGYTEAQAGSDLSALTMAAEERDDCYVINGQKIYQTESHYADYHWLAVRTSTETASHQGITLIVVDQKAPGVTVHPMQTLGGEQTNTVFYDGVRVPKYRVVGECGRGFYYLMEALDRERILLVQSASLVPTLRKLVGYTATARRRGESIAADPTVRRRLARLAVEIAAAHALERHAQNLMIAEKPTDYVASIVKLFASELRQRLAFAALDTLGATARLQPESLEAPLNGEIAHLLCASVIDTIGAGTSEILRNVIATRGLSLPRK